MIIGEIVGEGSDQGTIEIDFLIRVSRLRVFHILTIFQIFPDEVSEGLPSLLSRRSYSELADFFSASPAIRSLESDLQVLLIHKCRARLKSSVLIHGNLLHDAMDRHRSFLPGT